MMVLATILVVRAVLPILSVPILRGVVFAVGGVLAVSSWWLGVLVVPMVFTVAALRWLVFTIRGVVAVASCWFWVFAVLVILSVTSFRRLVFTIRDVLPIASWKLGVLAAVVMFAVSILRWLWVVVTVLRVLPVAVLMVIGALLKRFWCGLELTLRLTLVMIFLAAVFVVGAALPVFPIALLGGVVFVVGGIVAITSWRLGILPVLVVLAVTSLWRLVLTV